MIPWKITIFVLLAASFVKSDFTAQGGCDGSSVNINGLTAVTTPTLTSNLIGKDSIEEESGGVLHGNSETEARAGDVECAKHANHTNEELLSDVNGSIPKSSQFGIENAIGEGGPASEDRTPDVGTRLILTDLVEAGNISEARALAEVKGGPFQAHITSYSGFFTVDRRFDSNLFFWFFPAQTNYERAPVLLWLQGGPGASSLFGLFNELGPFSVAADETTLIENPHSWHKNHSLIFIDNPVGTGFSFTKHLDGYATNLPQIGESLYSALIQFFKMFPEIQANEFFIAGESYGGKYVPVIGHTIHKRNPSAELKINLKGIAMGNAFTEPECMVDWSNFVFQLGLVDNSVKQSMESLQKKEKAAIHREKFIFAATVDIIKIIVFSNNAGFESAFNILQTSIPDNLKYFVNFLDSHVVRERLHVGNETFASHGSNDRGKSVYSNLFPMRMVSATPFLEELLDHYMVLYYNGQLDIACGYRMSLCLHERLRWGAAEEYKIAKRHAWYVGKDLAGYMKSAGNFTEVLVRNAGHMVPTDQPVWALDLITQFTSNNFRHQQNKQ